MVPMPEGKVGINRGWPLLITAFPSVVVGIIFSFAVHVTRVQKVSNSWRTNSIDDAWTKYL
jgi:uncharacterized integral membrane protein